MKQYNSLQEVYDTAVAGLASQEFQGCYIDGAICAYRGTEGRKCAIGYCIPDEMYSPDMEEKSIRTLFREFTEEMMEIFLPSISVDHLAELQKCHDIPSSPEGRRDMLRDYARRYKLKMPQVLEVRK